LELAANMLIKKPIKITPKRLSIIFTTMITLIAIIILSFISLFLYKNFYQTITETSEILILRQKVAIDTVDMAKFNAIMDRLTQKTTPKELGNVSSPFH